MGRYVEATDGQIVYKYRGNSELGRIYLELGIGSDYRSREEEESIGEEWLTLDGDGIAKIEAVLAEFPHWENDQKNSAFFDLLVAIVEFFGSSERESLELCGEGVYQSEGNVGRLIAELKATSFEEIFVDIDAARTRSERLYRFIPFLRPPDRPPLDKSMIERARALDEAMRSEEYDRILELIPDIEPKPPIIYALERVAVRKTRKRVKAQ